MDGDPTLAVYVIHWRAPGRALETVRSLRQSLGVDLEVIVVDNASGQDVVAELRARLGGVRIIETGANLGYAGAANVALNDARGQRVDAVALAAHDLLVDPLALRLLSEALTASPEHAIVGPAHWDPAFGHAESIGGMFRAWGGGPLVPPGDAPPADENGIVDARFVSGALMVLRPSLLAEIEGMDARLFAYWEDVDLCLQARRRGHRVGVVTQARAAETGYSASHQDHAYLIARNHLLVARRHFGRTTLVVGALGVATRAARAWAGSLIPTRSAAKRATSRAFARGRWRGLLDGLAQRGGPPPGSAHTCR